MKTTYSWLKENNLENNYKLIFESSKEEIVIPKTVAKSKYRKVYVDAATQQSNEVFIANINDAELACSYDGIGGTCIRTKGCVLTDAMHYWGDSLNESASIFEFDECSVISEKWGGSNYCHWLLTSLPKFGFLKLYDKIFECIAINSMKPKYIKEAFELLNIKRNRIVEFSNTPKIKVTNLNFCSPIGYGVNPNKQTCYIIRELFKSHMLSGKRRLYISRSGLRRVLNEDAVIKTLLPYGFEIIKSETLSFQEQIAMFSQAEVVIGPHGAGFSNIVFCDPGTKVLEIFSPTYIGHCYWFLGASNNLDLYYLVGEGDERYDNQYYWSNGSANMTVNIKELEEILELMNL